MVRSNRAEALGLAELAEAVADGRLDQPVWVVATLQFVIDVRRGRPAGAPVADLAASQAW